MRDAYDLAVVGGGILGLAHALAAARRGLSVAVLDRDARANGASIRNFGFVTVTGQEAGATWRRARRSREVWDEVAPKAGIAVEHRGLAVVARRPEAAAVLEAFAATGMGEGCALLTPQETRARFAWSAGPCVATLWSPHDMRVESREALPKLAAFLAEAMGVDVLWQTAVHAVEPGLVATSRGPIRAARIAVCPGDDFGTLFPERIAAYGLTRCKLHMLRVDPGSLPRVDCSVMTDLSLVRYLGYAALPQAAALKAVLEREQGEHLAHGIHLIVVRSADGSLVVGDSHHYGPTPDPFQPSHVDALMLDEYRAVFGRDPSAVTARWIGTYASAPDRPMLVDRPAEDIRIVIVTSGTGASTSFAIAEEVVGELFA